MPSMLTAVSSSVKQLFLLLRCIALGPKALVQITSTGLRFSVEEAKVVQAIALLEKTLFTSYRFEPPIDHSSSQPTEDPTDSSAVFQISLPTLLETLQIFGFNDSRDSFTREGTYNGGNDAFAHNNAAFNSNVLGVSSVCRFSYAAPGEPLCITLEEGGVVTTCELNTYEPDHSHVTNADDPDESDPEDTDIPFARHQVIARIIMHPSHLHDAITELSSTSPDRLTLMLSPTAPHFVLSATGALGSATVEFAKDPTLLETFQTSSAASNAYKFAHIKAAGRAMAMASKVSVRVDFQGVLSLQFMIDNEGGGAGGKDVSFVDFRFVPFVDDGEGEDEEDEGDSPGDEAP